MTAIRPATKADAEAWLAMRAALWPDANVDELRLEVGRYFVAHGEPLLPHCVFVADDRGKIVGMLELSLRPYADGCDSSPVPFIEAWYVVPDARRSGVGGALVKAAEEWRSSMAMRRWRPTRCSRTSGANAPTPRSGSRGRARDPVPENAEALAPSPSWSDLVPSTSFDGRDRMYYRQTRGWSCQARP